MSSRLQRDEALEKEDRIDEMKIYKDSPPVPHLLQAQQAPVLPYVKVVGRPGTGSYPAPRPTICFLANQGYILYIILSVKYSGKFEFWQ